MLVGQAMTRDVRIATPNQSLHDVAKIMADCDIGWPCAGPGAAPARPAGA